ncbi:unnamed protein product, partial [marine sediment metagenome]
HKRNLTQNRQLGVSQSAVDTAYKLHGHLNTQDKQQSTNIAVFIGERITGRGGEKETKG